MYYYGNGYNNPTMTTPNYGTPYYYQPYYGGSSTSYAWAFALVVFILLIIVGCWCSRNSWNSCSTCGNCFR